MTSSYNPTGNSISERINGQINDILRIYRGQSIQSLKEKIETRLNFTYNRNLRYSPYEIIYKNSPFENINIRDNINYQKIINYTRQNITKNENKTNAERKTHQYLENQYIYKRKHSPDKLDPKWKGP